MKTINSLRFNTSEIIFNSKDLNWIPVIIQVFLVIIRLFVNILQKCLFYSKLRYIKLDRRNSKIKQH